MSDVQEVVAAETVESKERKPRAVKSQEQKNREFYAKLTDRTVEDIAGLSDSDVAAQLAQQIADRVIGQNGHEKADPQTAKSLRGHLRDMGLKIQSFRPEKPAPAPKPAKVVETDPTTGEPVKRKRRTKAKVAEGETVVTVDLETTETTPAA